MVASNQNIWTFRQKPDPAKLKGIKAVWHHLANGDLNDRIAELLVQREIDTEEKLVHFFKPQLKDLYDPFLMKDMKKAVNRLETAFEYGEKILVYGDYDVDGTTAVALVFSFLRELGAEVGFYIPDRYEEGYGISRKGIEYASKENYHLMIALDCGIKAVEKIDYANELGLDVIICDHHTPGEKVPEALAVLDPQQSDCHYPYKGLSGCGVGFKLLQALCIRKGIDLHLLYSYLDLLAISIGADIVPITGENRILASHGIRAIFDNPRPGLKKLFEKAGFQKKGMVTITDLVFVIAPRINAAGRIASGETAVELLMAKTENEAERLSSLLEKSNETRKDLDKSTTVEALELISSDQMLANAHSTVIWKENWHKGVVGIVASRLIEKHYRPTVVLTVSGDMATGSARSVSGFDIHSALEKCADCIEQFGGHPMAAGLSLRTEKLQDFRTVFDKVVGESILETQKTPEITIDLEISLNEITNDFYKLLRYFSPFGPENMKPVFLSKNLIDAGRSATVASDDTHLRLHVKEQGGNDKFSFSGIGFGLGHHIHELISGKPFSIVYTLEENEFRGHRSLQLNVKDIRFDGG